MLPNTRLPLNPTLRVLSYNTYSGRGNQYVDDNIREIQNLYKDREQKKESNKGRVENEEVILIKPYEVSKSTSSTMTLSFINDEVHEIHLLPYINEIIQTIPTLPITSIQRRTRS